ncbi:hypothetical protein, partial [uncultured Gammaproteobacteria bacterium]
GTHYRHSWNALSAFLERTIGILGTLKFIPPFITSAYRAYFHPV